MTEPVPFVWGAATAAYQIEGAAFEGGRGRSIWDDFCAEPGRIANGDSGEIACNHYYRYREDVSLLSNLGIDAYRFSVSWPRVIPNGVGEINTEGLAFYDRLVDELLAAEIQPWLTLYHWDLPSALQARGGWLNRDVGEWFAEYTEVLATCLGDRVQNWITINEPHCTAWFGHYKGWFAPGITDLSAGIAATHHQLLAHGRAVEVLRNQIPEVKVGISLGLTPCVPASDNPTDVAAAYRQDGYDLRWFLDPIYGKGYPQDTIALLGQEPPVIAGDLDIISAPTDFLGVNFYLRQIIADDPTNLPLRVSGVDPENAQMTAMGWEVHPESLTDLLVRLQQDYAPKEMFITENGSAWDDLVESDGSIHDSARVEYLRDHLTAVETARSAGITVNGYFAWSLLDNFEWTAGYAKRFGLIHIDYETQLRTPKDSFKFYRDFIAHRAR